MSETGQIRRARRTDARAIAQIQVETWRSAYAGILPDRVMVDMSVDSKASYWRRVIDRQGQRPSLPPEAEMGCTLISFVIEHPDAGRVAELYRTLGVTGSPEVRQGEEFRYTATIGTPSGIKVLS